MAMVPFPCYRGLTDNIKLKFFRNKKEGKDMHNRIRPVTKITRPVSVGAYPRDRLFDRLDQKLDRPVVYVSAPAGSGKTTLITGYIEARSLPCIWYRIDRGDDDIAAFFYYMGLAAKKAAPRKRKPLPLLTPEYRHDVPTFTRRYFEALLGRLKPPYMMVFDNYHEAPEQSLFHKVIQNGLDTIPAGINVILVSRNNPPPALTRMRANNMMDLLGWDDIRLTDEETRGIINLQGRRAFSEREIQRICRITKGWAAGLILLIERSRTKSTETYPAGNYTLYEIFDYFAEEIFNGMDESTRDFLQRTAFLKEITPQLAMQITGSGDAEKILARLHAGNYFTERHHQPDVTYCYHPLFREFLLSRARDMYADTDIIRIHRKSALLLEKAGNIEEAASLYIDGSGWKSLAALIAGHARSMVMQGRDRTLREWISALPDNIITGSPWLLYWTGVCRMASGPAESRSFFEHAYRLFIERKDMNGALMSWSGVVETYLHELGDLRPLDRWISILDGILGKRPVFPSAEVDACVTARMFGALAVRKPWHPQFPMWMEKAVTALNTCPDTSLRMLTGFYLHTFAIWTGDYPQAEYIVGRLKDVAGSANASPLAGITLRMAGTWAWLSGSCDASLRAMSDGLAMSAETGVHIWDYLLMVQGVAASLSSGDIEKAGDLLGRMGNVEENGRLLDKFYYHYELSWYFHLKDDLPRALMHQEKALKLADATGLHYAKAQSNLAISHLLHKHGNYSEAVKHLNRSMRISRRMKSRSIEFLCLLTRAHIAFNSGREGSARANLRKAMSLGREKGYVNFSWWHPAFISSLCVRALELDIETGYVQNLISRRRLTPDDPPVHIAKWPWPVRIRTFGHFEIMKDGAPVPFAGKTPRKPIELIRVLIALGGVNVDEGRLCDILWPDADGDAAHKSLEVTITRLRKLLDKRDAILFGNGHITINIRCCYIDTHAFEDLIGKADAAEDEGRSDRYTQYVRDALDLYKGPFLADEAGSWIISPRERLRDKFIRCTGKLCLLLEKSGKWEEAAARYLRGLEADDLIEEFYRGLIFCYGALGHGTQAVSAYRRCVTTLRSCGMDLSPVTEKVYKTVLKSGKTG
ncbi:MAG TPA: AAA family ATPase [Nitrospirae bacterium]|nr:AAA family ATPase [Nitrospirota bacterium]HDO34692.1 AAA family ATPase [Nitrospirota bacterium]